MEENKTLWNKKMDELTVGEVLKLNLAAPIVMVGGMVATGVIVVVSDKIITKFHEVRANRKNKTIQVVK